MRVSPNELRESVALLNEAAQRDELRAAVASELADSLAAALASRIADALVGRELASRLKSTVARGIERGLAPDRALAAGAVGLLTELAREAERHLAAHAAGAHERAVEARVRADERERLALALSGPENASEPDPGALAPDSPGAAQSPAEPVRGPDSEQVARGSESVSERPGLVEGQGADPADAAREPAARAPGEGTSTGPGNPAPGARLCEVRP